MTARPGSPAAGAFGLFAVLLAAAPTVAAPPGFDGRRAFADLEAICAIGPRISGTEGMAQQQQLLLDHFTELGAECAFQEFDVPHPRTGEPTRLRNLLVTWHPETTERILLGCHYDTRPRPDREPLPRNRDLPFIGANDGASGVAALMELGRQMSALAPRYGVDFVFFDAEEFLWDDRRDNYFLGSEHFAKNYVNSPPPHRYVAGVVLDMVADKDLRIYYEGFSLRYARPVAESVWKTAEKIGVKQFVARRRHEVRDDHLPLNQIAKIPTIDIIDFDYPHWHTRNDIPANCSAESLEAVGRVMVAWLSDLPDFSPRR
ncbi:MAG: M28 family peptidase [Planctomyces sp.]|nr:M28 family peptidase [Planctomyces sp.]